MSVNLIVAMDPHRGIGLAQRLPWHLPEDLRHFKATTLGHTVVMGRKTFESLPVVLKDRRQIVVSRTQTRIRDDVVVAKSVTEALRKATRRSNEEVFVIGGAQIYAAALPYVERMIITHVDEVHDCDTFFPEIDPDLWRETSRRHEHSASEDLDYRISVYCRTRQAEPIPTLAKATS